MARNTRRLDRHKPVTLTDLDTEAFIQDFRGLLWNSVPECGKTWQELAQDARLAHSTIENLLFGTTKKPQTQTVLKLLTAMGYRVGIMEASAGTQPDEVPLSRFRKNRLPARGKGRRKPLAEYCAKK